MDGAETGLTDGLWRANSSPADSPPTSTPNGTTRLRRDFEVKPGLARALIFVCGLGQQEMDLWAQSGR